MNIGDRIRELRTQKGISQKTLGEQSGTAETTIRQYEGNKRQPKIEQLEKIAMALGISPVTLMGWGYHEKSIRDDLAFYSYLESIGYIVKTEGDKVLESHEEIMTDDTGAEVGVATIVDEATFTIELIKEGNSTIFTDDEFSTFQEEIRKSVEYQLWQKNKST